MPDTTPYETPRKTLVNEYSFTSLIKNDEENSETFNKNFGYQNSSFLAKDLIKINQSKIKQKVKQTIDSINELRNSIIKKEISKNESPNNIIDLVEKILDYNH